MKQFYRGIIKKAYIITKRYPFLWFFGVFAAIMGNGREIQMLFRAQDTVPNLPTELGSWGSFFVANTPVDVLRALWELVTINPVLGIGLFIGLVLVSAFFIWLIMLAQAALVHSTSRVQNNKTIDFHTVFQAVKGNVWEVFSLNVFTRLMMYGALAILLLPFVGLLVLNNGNPVGMFGLILLSFIVVVPLAMVINFVLKYAIVFAVVDGLATKPAFVNAWKLFWKEWLVSIEFAILMFGINVLVVLATFALLFFLAVPFMALSVVLLANQFSVAAVFAVALTLIVFLSVFAIVGAGWAVFQYSAWTLLFFELKKGKAYAKLHRLVARA